MEICDLFLFSSELKLSRSSARERKERNIEERKNAQTALITAAILNRVEEIALTLVLILRFWRGLIFFRNYLISAKIDRQTDR